MLEIVVTKDSLKRCMVFESEDRGDSILSLGWNAHRACLKNSVKWQWLTLLALNRTGCLWIEIYIIVNDPMSYRTRAIHGAFRIVSVDKTSACVAIAQTYRTRVKALRAFLRVFQSECLYLSSSFIAMDLPDVWSQSLCCVEPYRRDPRVVCHVGKTSLPAGPYH